MQTQPVSPSPPPTLLDKAVTPSVRRREPILPASVKHPLVLMWVAIVPQVVLLLLNLRDYQLVVGEMTPWQRGMAQAIGVAELILLAGVAALAIFLRRTGRSVSWAAAWPLLAGPVLYLWFVVYQLFAILPQSVTVWILPPDQVLYDQFAFMMPLMFYAAIRLACADIINITRRLEWSITLSLAIGAPLILGAFVRWPLAWRLFRHVPELAFIAFFISLTIVIFAAVLRALVISYIAVRRKGPLALAILSFLVGIAGPVGGLLLNHSIPFPADFQARSVYLLALVNGVLLLLPNFRHPWLHRSVWLSQCLLFPFTLYFFIVFLPFLPFSVLGMLAVGTGFLVLTPTALFLVHGQRIYDGYRNEIRDGGRFKPAVLGILALSIIPVFYAVEAVIDRVVLRSAIDYVYAPNYRTTTHFEGSPRFVRRSLEHLRDAKAGLDLPFLSRFYNWVVFDGLVLPDDKMDHIHRAFLGTSVAPIRPGSDKFFGPRRPAARRATSAPPHNVVMSKPASTIERDGSCHRATVLIPMENLSNSVCEFTTSIDLPDGVLVSGFWLHIGKERVPGRVFEKKTALWVYQMIRDRTNRDPGILLYTSPHTLELRVYPFNAREKREVEVEFLYPEALHPTIAVGNENLHPSGENAPAGVVVTQTADAGTSVWLAPDVIAALPKANRIPYFHFIVDRSAGSDVTVASLKRAVDAAQARFPQARECLVTGVNFEIQDLTSELKPLESASSINISALPRQGGFMADRAIKQALLRYHDRLAGGDTAENAWVTRFPIFIVVKNDRSAEISEPDVSAFARFAPDFPGYFVSSTANPLDPRPLADGQALPAACQPVAVLKVGNEIAPCRSNADKAELIHFNSDEPAVNLEIFDPGPNKFVRLTPNVTIPAGTRYAAGTAAWHDYLDSIYNPSVGAIGLGKIVQRSRESGILVGATSYIVVENSAQWKMLERKQKQKLRNSSELEFEAVPEPSTWCLIILGVAFLVLTATRRSRTAA